MVLMRSKRFRGSSLYMASKCHHRALRYLRMDVVGQMIDVVIFFRTWMILIFGHALSDMALQHEYIGKYKARRTKCIDPLTGMQITVWPFVLSAHGLINGALVYWITGSVALGLAETILHILIDFCSCERWINLFQDQILHILCKGVWTYVWIWSAPL